MRSHGGYIFSFGPLTIYWKVYWNSGLYKSWVDYGNSYVLHLGPYQYGLQRKGNFAVRFRV